MRAPSAGFPRFKGSGPPGPRFFSPIFTGRPRLMNELNLLILTRHLKNLDFSHQNIWRLLIPYSRFIWAVVHVWSIGFIKWFISDSYPSLSRIVSRKDFLVGHKIQDILVTSNTALVQHRHTAGCSKVGRVFPMVIWPEIPMLQHGDDGHWEDTLHLLVLEPFRDTCVS